ncbi:MAG: hypothetical protein ABIY70_20285 [Capsulimonas sp.]|uniref:hypothetical protein n=1 Tax=Capsulimonas sp. TaxID=2494211 RepID=UPI0032636375
MKFASFEDMDRDGLARADNLSRFPGDDQEGNGDAKKQKKRNNCFGTCLCV